MEDEKKCAIVFNDILQEEISRHVELRPLPLDPDFKLKYADTADKSVYIQSSFLACPKTAGIRCGEMDFGGAMTVNFGSVPPGPEYDFPVLGYTFVLSDRFLICVLDLHPISTENVYREKYISPLKDVSQKYAWIPKAEGGRSEVHDWAKQYESGYSFYRWCEGTYLGDVQEAFRDYIQVFCSCIKKAEPVKDPQRLSARADYIQKYCRDYAGKDPGSNPLKHYFGEEWGERYMNGFLFAP